MKSEIEDLRAQRAETGVFEAGRTFDVADFELRERMANSIDGQIRQLVRRQIVVRRGLDERDKALAVARREARAAERARDQIDTLGIHVAQEEARADELREELAAEPAGKPRTFEGGSGP